MRLYNETCDMLMYKFDYEVRSSILRINNIVFLFSCLGSRSLLFHVLKVTAPLYHKLNHSKFLTRMMNIILYIILLIMRFVRWNHRDSSSSLNGLIGKCHNSKLSNFDLIAIIPQICYSDHYDLAMFFYECN